MYHLGVCPSTNHKFVCVCVLFPYLNVGKKNSMHWFLAWYLLRHTQLSQPLVARSFKSYVKNHGFTSIQLLMGICRTHYTRSNLGVYFNLIEKYRVVLPSFIIFPHMVENKKRLKAPLPVVTTPMLHVWNICSNICINLAILPSLSQPKYCRFYDPKIKTRHDSKRQVQCS